MSQDIRDNLKVVIRDKGYIQAVIAKKANISPCKLSQILNKSRKLEANELFDICEVIEMTPSELRNYKI
ncbi:MAG: helix-turn-helix domain-containing protein [Roseburia sp.]|nr:helix-turn-helix domain-containing protein [Roseburia sp.]